MSVTAADPDLPPQPGPLPPHELVLEGEIEYSRQAELDELVSQLGDGAATHVRVDLERVTFIESTGLAFLVRLRNICRQRDGSVTLVRPSPAVLRLLTLVNFEAVFDLELDQAS